MRLFGSFNYYLFGKFYFIIVQFFIVSFWQWFWDNHKVNLGEKLRSHDFEVVVHFISYHIRLQLTSD